MSNTAADNYIDSLDTGSVVDTDLGACTILYSDSHSCTVRDDDGDIFDYNWGEIAEFWELKQAEDKADEDSNRGIDESKNY